MAVAVTFCIAGTVFMAVAMTAPMTMAMTVTVAMPVMVMMPRRATAGRSSGTLFVHDRAALEPRQMQAHTTADNAPHRQAAFGINRERIIAHALKNLEANRLDGQVVGNGFVYVGRHGSGDSPALASGGLEAVRYVNVFGFQFFDTRTLCHVLQHDAEIDVAAVTVAH